MISPAVEARWAEARAFVADLAPRVCLRGAVLDRWRGTDRVLYDAPCLDRCPAECEACELFRAIGPGSAPGPADLVTALVPAQDRESELPPSGRRRANCMTFEQYLEGLVGWITAPERARSEVAAALARVHDFRLLSLAGVSDCLELERTAKRIVARECIVRFRTGDERAPVAAGAARRLGLLG